ncbi:hypothetical protein [uncultured Mycolicibacterium sp.]|uniref:hypothetical protein n=1 Tax=uncultured Mycolicibacterium sp. TaxID=2320817 RepID=UPI00262E4672|nr:hypothetical protein [uncultured Mycolicibacterium sp.]
MAVVLRKLLRIGKLPEELRAELEREGILHVAEYVPVTRRFSGRIPGLRSPGTVAGYVGSVVITRERVLTTLSTVPVLAGRTMDQRFDAEQTGAVTATVSPGGILLEADLAAVDERFTGQLSLHYKDPVPESVLAQLPRRTLAFDVSPEYVFRAVGIPYHP